MLCLCCSVKKDLTPAIEIKQLFSFHIFYSFTFPLISSYICHKHEAILIHIDLGYGQAALQLIVGPSFGIHFIVTRMVYNDPFNYGLCGFVRVFSLALVKNIQNWAHWAATIHRSTTNMVMCQKTKPTILLAYARAGDKNWEAREWNDARTDRLTARAMIPVTIPVLITVIRYGDPKANSDIDSGFKPFFRCPICRK